MGEGSKYYDVTDFNNWKRKQGTNLRPPPQPNFLFAANYIRKLLDGKNVNWAVMGGLAMLCLGSRRDMLDLHIVYDGRDFERIKAKLESEKRVKLPKGMNSLFPSKIFIKTGPAFNDAGCTENADVELDLVPPGSQGAPPSDVLRKNQVLLRLTLGGKAINFKGLNMLYLMRTTLAYCTSQNLAWDPRGDIVFLCQAHGKQLGVIRSQLDKRTLHDNFFASPYFASLPKEEQRRCSVALLGKKYYRAPARATEPSPLSRSTPKMQTVASIQGPERVAHQPHASSSLNKPLPQTNGSLAQSAATIATVGALVSGQGVQSETARNTQDVFRSSNPGGLCTPPVTRARPWSMEYAPSACQATVNVFRPQIVHGYTPSPLSAALTKDTIHRKTAHTSDTRSSRQDAKSYNGYTDHRQSIPIPLQIRIPDQPSHSPAQSSSLAVQFSEAMTSVANHNRHSMYPQNNAASDQIDYSSYLRTSASNEPVLSPATTDMYKAYSVSTTEDTGPFKAYSISASAAVEPFEAYSVQTPQKPGRPTACNTTNNHAPLPTPKCTLGRTDNAQKAPTATDTQAANTSQLAPEERHDYYKHFQHYQTSPAVGYTAHQPQLNNLITSLGYARFAHGPYSAVSSSDSCSASPEGGCMFDSPVDEIYGSNAIKDVSWRAEVPVPQPLVIPKASGSGTMRGVSVGF